MENIKSFPEQSFNQETMEEIKNNLLKLINICDSSPEFLTYVKEALGKTDKQEDLFQIKLSKTTYAFRIHRPFHFSSI